MYVILATTTISKFQPIFFKINIFPVLTQTKKKTDRNGNIIHEKQLFATVITSLQELEFL